MARPPEPRATDGAPWHAPRVRRDVAVTRRAVHVTMPDGVRIAVDVHLPADRPGARLPTVMRQTRYFRGIHLRRPFARPGIEFLLDHSAPARRRFLAAGYACVDVCARGSGASFGSRLCPWSPDEIADGARVVDWIVAQPWSNGVVGATGVSYDGTSADFLLVNQHPAVRAIVPRFSLFDAYPDVAFPGGIHLSWFTERWRTFNQALDDNRLDRAFSLMIRHQAQALADVPARRGPLARAALRAADTDGAQELARRLLTRVATGVRRVDGDAGALLAAAIEEHRANFDVHEGAARVVYRDDAEISPDVPEATIDFFSPHTHVDRIAGSGAAVYSYSGWFDGGYANAAVKRFLTLPAERSSLLLGPWDHGGTQNVSPSSPTHRAAFDHEGEMLRFFDRHLRGVEDDEAPRVRYFTMVEDRWKNAPTWPPPHARVHALHLDADRRLSKAAPVEEGVDEHRLAVDVGTGRRSRWRSLLGLLPPTGYGDRGPVGRRLLVYRGARLERSLEVTGHPVVSLHARVDGDDAYLFAYLEDEHPDGRVDYVTEGHLRALHRRVSEAPHGHVGPYHSFRRADAAPLDPEVDAELRFALLPVSWRYRAGHRVRLAIAGSDVDHFRSLGRAPTIAVRRGGSRGSRLELPVVEGGGAFW